MLAAGDRLGVYEIRGPLGAGGMGEVYRARDTRLGRDVALKILPGDLAGDAGRIARFEQEARTVAALNHPNIVAVHDIGRQEGTAYIVSELVDGVTLRGLTPSTREVLHIAAQLADGLAAAHSAGITHRDLKPDNVMLTGDGRVKILDFGIAKISGPLTADARTATHTNPGVVVGTMGYMAPEQVRAVAVDHRADIFAFGALLYELVSGARAFTGDTGAEVMTAVLKADPPELPPPVPGGIRQIIQRCLEKKPEARFQSAHDLAFALRHLSGTATAAAPAPPAPARKHRLLGVAGAAFAVGALAAGLLTLRWTAADDAAIDPVRLTRLSAERESETSPAFSPDGRSLAYVRSGSDGAQLLVRPVDAMLPVVLARGLPPGARPLWSADGNRVCFAGPPRSLQCVSAAGGAPQRLIAEATAPQFTRDGSALHFIRAFDGAPWLFRSAPPGAAAERVGREPLSAEITALSPVSPDGARAIAFGPNGRWVISLADGMRRALDVEPGVKTRSVTWLGDASHIVVAEELAETVGFRVTVQDTASAARRLVVRSADPISSLTVSPDGRKLVYSSGPVHRDIAEYSSAGSFIRDITTSVALEAFPAWSPAGDRFVYQVGGPGQSDSLWISDAEERNPSMLHPLAVSGFGRFPQMSPDGTRVAYLDPSGVFVVSAAGGPAVRVVAAERSTTGLCWSPDGEWIFYSEGPTRLARAPSQGGPSTLIATSPGELVGCSPDGQWLARRGKDGYVLTSPDGQTERPLARYSEHARAPNSPQFGDGGRIVYLLGSDRRSIVVRETATGRQLRTMAFTLPAGDEIFDFAVHPAAARVLLSTGGDRYDLWMAEGFAQPATSWRRWFRHWETPAAEEQ